MNYYNEWDKGAAAWLRELINAGHIPPGIVDERSITEVRKEDLAGFTQCHFFCGIGGWSLALQLAGVPSTQPLWTGSPPCQPFSVAGKQLGKDDPRHLAPAFLELIAQCRPERLYGEQVAAAIGKHWLDALLIELEEQGYACGAAVLPACSVGAPHKRDRLFFGAALRVGDTASQRQCADQSGQHCGAGQQLEGAESRQYDQHRCADGELADSAGLGRERGRPGEKSTKPSTQQRPERFCDAGSSMANSHDTRSQGWYGVPERADQQPAGAPSVAGRLADAGSKCERQDRMPGTSDKRVLAGWQETSAENAGLCCDRRADAHHSFWSDADWLGCRDGKFRPVRSGTFPLANGVPARVGRLRGYGNAIVPQVAAEFIKAFNGAIDDQKEKASTKNK